jgi:tetratricopeptide (TPR) repeat protein
MQKYIRSMVLISVLGLSFFAGLGCSQQSKKERHLTQAERHYAAGKYDEAEIEYKNVVQLEPQNAVALGRLGCIYYEQTRLFPARAFLQRASELQPDNLELQVKLGLIAIAFRDAAGARAKAEAILSRKPDHPEAPLLLVMAVSNPKEAESAQSNLLKLPPAVVESAPVQLALGMLKMQQNQLEAAETHINSALARNPKYAEAHAALASIHFSRKNAALAEQEYRLASEQAPARSALRINYAQFKIQNGDLAGGRALVEQITKDTPDYLPAWMLLANMASAEKKYDESLAFVGKVLARDSLYPDAMLLGPRLRMAKGEFAIAVTELDKALRVFPNSPQFLYQAGLAYVATGEIKKAMESLNLALNQAPEYTDAKMLLASLQLQTGDQGAAISALISVIKERPDMIQPRLMLADAYRARNNHVDALAVYDRIDVDFPGNPRTPLLRGIVLLQQRKFREAREAFNQSLERAPDFLPAVEQLVTLDLLEKQFANAQQRVEAQIAKQPKLPELYIQLARVLVAQKEVAKAESVLEQAIDLNPALPAPYYILATLYVGGDRQQEAMDKLQKMLTINPSDPRALLMTGMLHEQLKQYDQALAAYEKLLSFDPKSGIALNNAAFLYAERFNQLDKAFAAAQKARELYPLDPHVADTLGWILIQRRQYPWALTLIQESAAKLPTSADVQYHLGIARYMMGEEELARQALENALQLNPSFRGNEAAKKSLTLLQFDPAQPGAAQQKIIDAALAERPDDPIALARRAVILEAAGQFDGAIAACEAVLQTNPANVRALLSLIRLHTTKGNSAQALELAKNARKVAPENAAVNLALGRLVYDSGDFAWAFSLLQEYGRRQPDDPEGLQLLAKAAYSVGQVDVAKSSMSRSLELEPLAPSAPESRKFLELLNLADNPAQAAASAATIEAALKSNPKSVPALMAAAAASERKGGIDAAIGHYEKVLEQYSEFNPARRRLVILLSNKPGDPKRAFELALKARTAFPDDPELAKAYGIILYRQGDFARALSMLRDSSADRQDDAELLYYLGRSQHRTNDSPGAKRSLQRALELNLRADLASEARKIIAEIK